MLQCLGGAALRLTPEAYLRRLVVSAVQDSGRPELHAENAAYAREVAELFASSRRGIDRSLNSSFSSPGVRTSSAGSGLPAARPGFSLGTVSQPMQASTVVNYSQVW